jgi:hypothetical protein
VVISKEGRINALYSGNSFDNQVLSRDCSRFVEAANVNSPRQRDTEWLGAEDSYKRREGKETDNTQTNSSILPNLDSAMSDELTARESSIGSSGGTTEVMIMTQSKRSFVLLRLFSTPAKCYV